MYKLVRKSIRLKIFIFVFQQSTKVMSSIYQYKCILILKKSCLIILLQISIFRFFRVCSPSTIATTLFYFIRYVNIYHLSPFYGITSYISRYRVWFERIKKGQFWLFASHFLKHHKHQHISFFFLFSAKKHQNIIFLQLQCIVLFFILCFFLYLTFVLIHLRGLGNYFCCHFFYL